MSAAEMQQAHLHQQIMAQQLLGVKNQQSTTVPGIADVAAITLDRKQREAYVGNLSMGIITKQLLEEFFNQALSHMMPDPVATPPVININMEPQGRFAFVEFRTRELANQALLMDKLVELHGRQLHVGRPKGYLEPTAPPLPLSIAAPAAPTGAPTTGDGGGGGGGGGQPTIALLLSNILPIGKLRSSEERQILLEEVQLEASVHGAVQSVAVPPPPPSAQDRGPGRAYILYGSLEDAAKAKKIFHTRTLDDNPIKAHYVQPEEFQLAARGEWAQRHASVAGYQLPGLYTIGLLSSGISGLTALSPQFAALAATNPAVAAVMRAAIDEDEVPFEEGWVKLRGFSEEVTKPLVSEFFKGCGELNEEEDIKMVYSADGTWLGEAFVHLRGPSAKLRLALARDTALLPGVKVPAEVLTSFEEDMHRRGLSGCVLR